MDASVKLGIDTFDLLKILKKNKGTEILIIFKVIRMNSKLLRYNILKNHFSLIFSGLYVQKK